MSINKDEIANLSNLAQIFLTDHEKSNVLDELNEIVGFFDQIIDFNIQNVEPLSHPTSQENFSFELKLREDVAEQVKEQQYHNNIAPKIENGHYLVPKVVE